jgi:TRAP-type C4-dicarboxylate transport system permease small subunit
LILVSALASLVRLVSAVQLWLAGIIFIGCVLLYGAEVFTRGFLNSSIPEYFEIVGIGFVYVFLFGAAALYGRDEDIIIGFLFDRVPQAVQKWWLLGVHLLVMVTMAVTGIAAFNIMQLQWSTPTPLLGISESTRWFPLAIASISIVFTSGCRVVACIVWLSRRERPQILYPTDPIQDGATEV